MLVILKDTSSKNGRNDKNVQVPFLQYLDDKKNNQIPFHIFGK